MGKEEDFQYAVRRTRLILPPRQTLQTFGTTTLRYHLLSELMDNVGQVRVRAGKVYSERPQIINPFALADQMLNGFGEQAQHYAEFLREHGDLVRIMRYGLQFRKDEVSAEIVHEPLDDLANRLRARVEGENDPLTAVIVGADELWEVSLLKFLVDYIERSLPTNISELQERERAERPDPRREIEDEFQRAAVDASRIKALGQLLQRRGLFEQYEDRFYALVRRARR